MYGWMQTESAGASNRGREREGEREKERCGGELDCSDYSYTMARFFFSAAIIPLSGTAGHRGKTSNVWNI